MTHTDGFRGGCRAIVQTWWVADRTDLANTPIKTFFFLDDETEPAFYTYGSEILFVHNFPIISDSLKIQIKFFP